MGLTLLRREVLHQSDRRKLAAVVAAELGTGPELALVAAGERRYRRVEADAARALLEEARRRGRVPGDGPAAPPPPSPSSRCWP